MQQKKSFFDQVVAWIKFAADIIDVIRDKYNEHFKGELNNQNQPSVESNNEPPTGN